MVMLFLLGRSPYGLDPISLAVSTPSSQLAGCLGYETSTNGSHLEDPRGRMSPLQLFLTPGDGCALRPRPSLGLSKSVIAGSEHAA